MAYKISITVSAYNDINEILSYISDVLKNPIAAANLLDSIEKRYNEIALNPEMFSVCNDARLQSMGYRKVVINNYILFYKVDAQTKTVYIMRVIYARRDYGNVI